MTTPSRARHHSSAGQQQQQQPAAGRMNYVTQDQIWKDHITLETATARSWPENWGFMKDSYYKDMKRYLRTLESWQTLDTTASPTPGEDFDSGTTPTQDRSWNHGGPSSMPYPSTESQKIGWRSTKKALALEKYGCCTQPKGSIIKRFDWPFEAIE